MDSPVVLKVGANSTPASAAMMKPRAHPICEMRNGLAPDMATSSGSSTTARMATPVRVRLKNKRRNRAAATATPMVMSCS